jgi:protein-tyrosine phosphatase
MMAVSSTSSTPAKIIDNLYLGGVSDAHDREKLGALGVGRILNLTPRYPPRFKDEFTYLHLALCDELDTDLKSHFESAHAFISSGVDRGEAVLVHCEAGISRSSRIVISYLMNKAEMSLCKAYEHVQSCKPNIGPNKHFLCEVLLGKGKSC